MGDGKKGGPLLLKKEESVKLAILVKTSEKEIERRLAIVYDLALRKLQASLDKEAAEYTKKLNAASGDLIKVIKLIDEKPTYLIVKPGVTFSVNGELSEVYQKKLQNASDLKDIARIISEAEKDGVKISIRLTKLKANTGSEYIQSLKDARKFFVDNSKSAILTGFNERRIVSFSINPGNEKVAELFVSILNNEIGVPRPKLEEGKEKEIVMFEDAQIQKGHYPLSFDVDGNSIKISWPDWIYTPTQEFDFEEKKKGGKVDLKGLRPKKLA